jgi:hypothetical protein
MARAQLLDEREEQKLNDNEEQGSFEETQEVAQEEPQATQEDNLPEKYRGKSMEEIIAMHQNAEKLLGKQSSEVGQLRSVVDEYIQAQLEQQKEAPVQPQQEDDVDFFVDPDKAVARAIDNHPKIKEAEEYTQNYKRQTALSQLKANHPDMQEILNDNNFAEWVKASKIRTQLFVQADQQYDYEAANELFSLWKERAGVAKQTVAVERQARKQQLKSANTGNARGTAEGSRKKVYRRADIIKLMRDDPERYQSLSNEIMQAYQEGRVR